MTNPAHRGETLDEAKRLTCGERNKTYGEPIDNLRGVAKLWNAYLYAKYQGSYIAVQTFQLTPEDVAWLHVLAKIARTVHSYKHDNYVDAAAYAAIAGECGFKELQDILEEYDNPPDEGFAEGTTHRISNPIDGRITS